MLFSHTGKGGMTCAIEQHPGRGHGTRPRHIEDGTPAECCVAGPGSCSPRRGRLVRKDIVMRLALRKRFACPACQIASSEGWSDSRWQGSRNYMGVFKSSVKNAASMRENTEKLGSREVATREQPRWAENVCGGCNWVAILGELVGRFLAGCGFRRFGVTRCLLLWMLGVRSSKINQLMIVSTRTESGRCICAVNPSFCRHRPAKRKLIVIFMK